MPVRRHCPYRLAPNPVDPHAASVPAASDASVPRRPLPASHAGAANRSRRNRIPSLEATSPKGYPSAGRIGCLSGLHDWKLSADVDTFRYRWQSRGLGLREDIQPRRAFLAASRSAAHDAIYRHSLYATALTRPDATPPRGEVLHESSLRDFSWALSPGLNQNLGGPDGYLYQLYARLDAEYRTDTNGWLSGEIGVNLADNLDNYTYIADSELPRVRTHIGDYLAGSRVGIHTLQYTRTTHFARNWYAMGYGGLLEMMYAGAGGEVLYRPFNSPLALGADLNWVRQRDFDQRFDLRDYSTWTGHATAYLQTGVGDVLAKLSVGRYLAGDLGTTLDLSRRFANGVNVGAWVTLTDAGNAYGEGDFDKGVYISIPLDAFFVESSRGYSTIAWQPLTRDGGARLARRYSLYGLTQERDMGSYWEDARTIMEP
ncbi:YjbH domain-containing protein [Modicisalibacter tunisiensis]|uniref:YjbH domain-containing protein n=1 Tax=Modicisalibacter tunisiensis TaxID=390637 RepID=A0ABS7X0Z6_9GAMM|nr:YjbH domain-containing protein [Modicisalibacter tunisiensis]